MNLETFTFSVDADGIALATFDVPGRSMNTLTARALADLAAIADEVKTNAAIKGLVITSGKPSGFCAGADLGELGGGGGDPKASTPEGRLKAQFDAAFSLNKTLRALETFKKPVAAAINGLALGGGLEVALGCHYRIAASDNPRLQLGLPEVKVGLMPGGGGTQRLPRLIGVQASAPYLLQGESMTAEAAKGLGVIHETAPTAELVAKAKAWVKANPTAAAPWDAPNYKLPGGGPFGGGPRGAVFTFAPAMVAKQTWGNYPNARNIISAVYEGVQVPMDAAVRIETRYFVKTLQTPEARGMVRSLFLSMQELGKGASRPKGFAPYDVKKSVVIGAGLMGAGIAYVQAKAGIETILLDVSLEAAAKGKAYSQRIVDKDVARGKMSKEKGDALLALIKPSTDYALCDGADIVVEAVFENADIKAEVTKKVEAHLGASAVMGTNTSTLPITGLAKASIRPANFIGIHFFSPVERMGLVEIITGKETSQETLAKAMDYVLKIKKTPIAVNDFRGFYTSRVFGTYPEEGMIMVAEGIAPAIVENVGRMAGMPMGPLEVSDSVGIDTMLKIGRESAKAAGKSYEQNPVGDLVAWIAEAQGRVGRKAGKGFYNYNDQGKPDRLYPDIGKKIPAKVVECPPELKAEFTKRLLYRQCIEVARCFEEGVILDARDADIGSILAWGFAPYSGGVCSFMDMKVGIKAFVAECDRLADAYGERFRPNALLRDMAARNQTFYSRFAPKDQKASAA